MSLPPRYDWRPLYPFASHKLRLGAVGYHYLDEGHGEPLLLVHGNPTWSFYWRNLVVGLRERYRLIVPDHVGCGLSDKPADYDYCLAQHASNLGRLIGELGLENITLVAHDWGGAIGLAAAVAQPERFARLVLLNTGAFRASRIPLRIRICRAPLLGPLVVRGLNGFARAALWMATSRGLEPRVAAGLLAPYSSWHNRIAIQRFVDDIPLKPGDRSYADLLALEQGLPRLAHLPTLLVWGMQDWCFTPWFLERFRDYFPAAEVRRLDEAGHYVVEDAPGEVLTALEDFLARHPLPVPR